MTINTTFEISDEILRRLEIGYTSSILFTLNNKDYNFSGIPYVVAEDSDSDSEGALLGTITKNYEYLSTKLDIEIEIRALETSNIAYVDLTLYENGVARELTSNDVARIDWSIDNSISLRENDGYIRSIDESVEDIYELVDLDPNYDPSEESWYEYDEEDSEYVPSEDTTVLEVVENPPEGVNPQGQEWYELEIVDEESSDSEILYYYVLTQDTTVQNGKTYYKYNNKLYYEFGPKTYYTQTKAELQDRNFIRLDRFGLYGVNNLNATTTYTPKNISQIKSDAMFSLTWDGYTLKTSHPDGAGKVEIGSASDIVVYENDNPIAIIGYLDSDDLPSTTSYQYINENRIYQTENIYWGDFIDISNENVSQDQTIATVLTHNYSYNTEIILLNGEIILEVQEINLKEQEDLPNPQSKGWFELINEDSDSNFNEDSDSSISLPLLTFIASEDDHVVEGKTYFENLEGKQRYYFVDEYQTLLIYDSSESTETDVTLTILPTALNSIKNQYGIYSKNLYIGDENNYLSYYNDSGDSVFIVKTDNFNFNTDIGDQKNIRNILYNTYSTVNGDLVPLYSGLNSWIAVGPIIDEQGIQRTTLQIADFSNEENSSELRLTSEQMSFWKNGIKSAYITGDGAFSMVNGLITDKMQFNNYAFINRTVEGDKHVAFKYLG